MENPVGQNGLTYHGLLHETAKVFGLRSRRLKLFLDEAETQGKHRLFLCLCKGYLEIFAEKQPVSNLITKCLPFVH